jgi:hypothetical protein
MKRSYVKYMGVWWSGPKKAVEDFFESWEGLGYVSDPREYGLREIKKLPRDTSRDYLWVINDGGRERQETAAK